MEMERKLGRDIRRFSDVIQHVATISAILIRIINSTYRQQFITNKIFPMPVSERSWKSSISRKSRQCALSGHYTV